MAKYREKGGRFYKISGDDVIEVEVSYGIDNTPDMAHIGYTQTWAIGINFMKQSKSILKKEFMETYKLALQTIKSKV